jgi:hypothetical protein
MVKILLSSLIKNFNGEMYEKESYQTAFAVIAGNAAGKRF